MLRHLLFALSLAPIGVATSYAQSTAGTHDDIPVNDRFFEVEFLDQAVQASSKVCQTKGSFENATGPYIRLSFTKGSNEVQVKMFEGKKADPLTAFTLSLGQEFPGGYLVLLDRSATPKPSEEVGGFLSPTIENLETGNFDNLEMMLLRSSILNPNAPAKYFDLTKSFHDSIGSSSQNVLTFASEIYREGSLSFHISLECR